jgi:hypothetical protein
LEYLNGAKLNEVMQFKSRVMRPRPGIAERWQGDSYRSTGGALALSLVAYLALPPQPSTIASKIVISTV